MKIIFTTLPGADYQGRALTDAGAKDRMLSFFHLRDHPPGFLEEYVTNGYVASPRKGTWAGRRKSTKIKQGFFGTRSGK